MYVYIHVLYIHTHIHTHTQSLPVQPAPWDSFPSHRCCFATRAHTRRSTAKTHPCRKVYVCIKMWTYVCIHTCTTHTHTYIYTHTHTHKAYLDGQLHRIVSLLTAAALPHACTHDDRQQRRDKGQSSARKVKFLVVYVCMHVCVHTKDEKMDKVLQKRRNV